MDTGVYGGKPPYFQGREIVFILISLGILMATMSVSIESMLNNEEEYSNNLFGLSCTGVALVGIAMLFFIGLGTKRMYESGPAGIIEALDITFWGTLSLIAVFAFSLVYGVYLYYYADPNNEETMSRRFLYIMSILIMSFSSFFILLLSVGGIYHVIRRNRASMKISTPWTSTTSPTFSPYEYKSPLEGLGLTTY
jgi:hypothetical protein